MQADKCVLCNKTDIKWDTEITRYWANADIHTTSIYIYQRKLNPHINFHESYIKQTKYAHSDDVKVCVCHSCYEKLKRKKTRQFEILNLITYSMPILSFIAMIYVFWFAEYLNDSFNDIAFGFAYISAFYLIFGFAVFELYNFNFTEYFGKYIYRWALKKVKKPSKKSGYKRYKTFKIKWDACRKLLDIGDTPTVHDEILNDKGCYICGNPKDGNPYSAIFTLNWILESPGIKKYLHMKLNKKTVHVCYDCEAEYLRKKRKKRLLFYILFISTLLHILIAFLYGFNRYNSIDDFDIENVLMVTIPSFIVIVLYSLILGKVFQKVKFNPFDIIHSDAEFVFNNNEIAKLTEQEVSNWKNDVNALII